MGIKWKLENEINQAKSIYVLEISGFLLRSILGNQSYTKEVWINCQSGMKHDADSCKHPFWQATTNA